MKTETLEIIVEELASALSLAKWKLEMAEAEISKLEHKIQDLNKGDKNNG